MKALWINGYGGPQNLVGGDVPAPVPTAGQIALRIRATTYNPIDALLASGVMREEMPLTFPWIPGADFSGVVESVGNGVSDLKVGDEVYGYSARGGSYAEQIAIDADMVSLKPRSLSDQQAASLALVAQTADQALDAAELKSGAAILIHGGAGAVGSVAVQLAHGLGAHVIATASHENVDYVLGLGADQVIDYKAMAFDSVVKDVDVVLDTIGGDTQARSFTVLRPGGCLVALNQPPSPELAAKYNVRTVMLDTKSKRSCLEALTKQIDSGEIKPKIGEVYQISDAPSVWRKVQTMRVLGKIVFVVSE